MSLHVLANHMASKGRGEDSMLVHMTPHEVASLQALALKNGGSLTINPDTGLPEASFLKKLLPMIAGFALGPAGFGLMSAGMAGATVGAVTGLATGSLSKGLMAGLGAYGGAGLGEAFMGAGANSIGSQALSNAGYSSQLAHGADALSSYAEAGALPQTAIGEASMADKLGAGFKAITASPETAMKFAGDNWKYGLAAASPLIADAMVPTTVKAPPSTPTGYIRPFQFDENTRTVTAQTPVLASEWGTRSFPDYIRKTQQPPGGMNRGGIVALADGGEADPYAKYNTMSGQSKAAYDYLMGNAARAYAPAITTPNRPVVSNTNVQPVTSTVPNEVQTGSTGTTGTGPTEAPTQPYVPPTELTDPRNNLPPEYVEPNPYTEPTSDPDYPDYIAPPDAPDYPDYIAPPDEYPVEMPDYIAPPDAPDYPDYIAPPDAPIYQEPVLENYPDYIAPPDEPAPVQEPVESPVNYPDYIAPPDTYLDDIPDYIAPNDGYITDPGYQDIPDYIAPPDAVEGSPVNYPDYIAPPDEPAPVQEPVESPVNYPDYIAPPDESQQPTEYETQPWENLDESGYSNGPMAGDNSLNSGNNTYVGPVDNVQQPGLPDEFGESPKNEAPELTPKEAEQLRKIIQEEEFNPYGGSTDIGASGEFGGYGGGEFGGGEFGGGEFGGGEFGGGGGKYLDQFDDMLAANGGLMGYARGGSARPFFSKETGKFSYKPPQVYANGGYAMGGLGSLGGYSDGGRLLKGPGDGVSDSIPASIGSKKQPARLADGEFVVPARIVSELGNGSTEAGARKLYAMMDRIQKARGNTVGKGKVATNSRADKHLPA